MVSRLAPQKESGAMLCGVSVVLKGLEDSGSKDKGFGVHRFRLGDSRICCLITLDTLQTSCRRADVCLSAIVSRRNPCAKASIRHLLCQAYAEATDTATAVYKVSERLREPEP